MPELQAPGERNIDPTMLGRETLRAEQVAWWAPIEHDHERWVSKDGAAWVQANDWPDSAAMLEVREPATGERWVMLVAGRDWSLERERRSLTPQRILRLRLRSYLVQQSHALQCWRWLARQQLVRQGEPDALDLHAGFVGEYPWGLLHAQAISEAAHYQDGNPPTLGSYPVEATFAWLGSEHEFDCYHEETTRLMMPAPRFFRNAELRWDGASGFWAADGTRAFFDPSLTSPGPSALLVRRDHLIEFLRRHNLAVV